MKKVLLCLLAALALTGLLAGASAAVEKENANEDGLYQFEVLEDGTAKLILFSLSDEGRTEFTLPDTVYDEDGNAYTVTDVGDIFVSFYGVRTVTIPDSITMSSQTGYRYFCVDAEEFRVSDSHPTLAVIDGVLFNKAEKALVRYPAGREDTEYTIPDGITTVGRFAFLGTQNLEIISIPNTVQTIGDGAFLQMSFLETVNLAPDHPTLAIEAGVLYSKPERALIAPVTSMNRCLIPEGIVRINEYAFHGYYYIDTVQTPSTLKEIGGHAFENSGVKRLLLSEGLESIGDYAFKACINLTEIDLPRSLRRIGVCAFQNSKFISFQVPENVTSIGEAAFFYSDLEEVSLPEGLLELGSSAFSYCDRLKSIRLPGSLQQIGSNVLSDCGTLESVTVCEGITALPSDMFSYSKSLHEVSLPAGLKEIGSSAFSNCAALQELTLPDGLEVIGAGAFYCCTGLKSLVIPESVSEISSTAFSGLTDLTLSVKKNSPAEMFCLKYGWNYLLEGEADLTPDVPDWLKPTEPPTADACPECGYVFPEGNDFSFCPGCGLQLRSTADKPM